MERFISVLTLTFSAKKIPRRVGRDIGNLVTDLKLRPDLTSWTLTMRWRGGEIAERNASTFDSTSASTFGRAKEIRPMILRRSRSLIPRMCEGGPTELQEH